MNGFGQDLEVVSLDVCLFEQVGGSGLTGEEQDLDGGEQGADADGGVDAIEVGHDDVRDQHIGLEGGSEFESFFSGIDGACLEAALVQNHGQGVSNHTFIVGDKDFGF